MKVAVIGGRISGLVAAYVLAKEGANVVLHEKEDYLGGHSRTVRFDGVDLDLGFMVFNRAGMIAANSFLGKGCNILSNPKLMVMTDADLGLADSYINEDFSFVDKNAGLLNLVMILISNRDLIASNSKLRKASLTSAKYFFKHVLRQNTLTQARRNISRHYNLAREDEDLKDARQKILFLIEKAKFDSKHEILEIGCGWGSLAIEVVNRTRCKHTGITLSEEQLKYAEMRVKEAGLQDNNSHGCRIQTLFAFYSSVHGKIIALGFDEKFIRTWEYYFDYCAAGFKSNTLGNYQVVFSWPGNVAALGNPYKGFPSAS
ncbi:putative LRR receptor-like serine/threonine-protein kinase [Hibiscus syriacus]|uniref:LRR receptor-like serine/threonine-protein kinase n=1 Tax=Hibiscus syriacus TaxID=106335 RepID=A0A6A3BIP3_HIBSY|nr:putative LRR receptor-like serine/threonine-protein kinase [Hibiscus syriacus]